MKKQPIKARVNWYNAQVRKRFPQRTLEWINAQIISCPLEVIPVISIFCWILFFTGRNECPAKNNLWRPRRGIMTQNNFVYRLITLVLAARNGLQECRHEDTLFGSPSKENSDFRDVRWSPKIISCTEFVLPPRVSYGKWSPKELVRKYPNWHTFTETISHSRDVRCGH